MSGRLITVEGLDGSGKTTQIRLLEQTLRERGVPFRKVKFPVYDQPFSAAARMYLNGEFGSDPDDVNAYAASTFFAVERFASYRTMWREDYEDGMTILADRYTTSNMIYQLPKLPSDEWEPFLRWLRDLEYGKMGLPEPALTIYLDMPINFSQKLLEKRYSRSGGQKDIHERDTAYLSVCRKSALFVAERLGWSVISCLEKDRLRSVGSIQTEISGLVFRALASEKAGNTND